MCLILNFCKFVSEPKLSAGLNHTRIMSNDLPEDLIVEIFSRLPTKSLLRFRSVSKSLYACIGSPDFIRLHALRSPKKVTIIYKIRRDKLVYTSLPENELSYNPYSSVKPLEYPFESFRIVGSCNGILCVYECGKGLNLWNPSIRRKVTVPDLRTSGDFLVHGFGFDPIIDDYKILRITRRNSFVYTLKTRAWREIASPNIPFSNVEPQSCIFNGVLHWVVNKTDVFDVCNNSYIMTFDLSSEVFSTIDLPEPHWETNGVTIIKGSLAVISTNRHGRSWIWVRREYNNFVASWSRAFEVNKYINPFKGVRGVFVRATNGDLLFKNCKVVGAYDLVNQIERRLQILSCSSSVVDMNVCDESLELLDMGTSCDQGSKSPGKEEKQNN
ncbi:putative F-box domain-containing protein [Helianthus annuus]|nr:putative F-box domain-containing protein [Helianthus annuus]